MTRLELVVLLGAWARETLSILSRTPTAALISRAGLYSTPGVLGQHTTPLSITQHDRHGPPASWLPVI
jgi:hypothetical protein